MNRNNNIRIRRLFIIVVALLISSLIVTPAVSGEYPALDGVKGIKAVFDVSLGAPQIANIVFWAVQNVYKDKNVLTLKEPPQVAVVFHGPAVKLISTNHEGFKDSDIEMLNKFADIIRQMKKDGVKIEVCGYALKVLGVDPASILPEVDHVGNGFISVVGYQAQGYSVVTIK
jgi:intracellular sulfur oxidation DsrE/DsrF family protein